MAGSRERVEAAPWMSTNQPPASALGHNYDLLDAIEKVIAGWLSLSGTCSRRPWVPDQA